MNMYLKALGLTKGLIILCNKNTCALTEVLISYDEGIYQEAVARFEDVLRSTKDDLPAPEYGPDGKGRLPWQCTYCAFCDQCHNTEVSFDNKGRPVVKVAV